MSPIFGSLSWFYSTSWAFNAAAMLFRECGRGGGGWGKGGRGEGVAGGMGGSGEVLGLWAS